MASPVRSVLPLRLAAVGCRDWIGCSQSLGAVRVLDARRYAFMVAINTWNVLPLGIVTDCSPFSASETPHSLAALPQVTGERSVVH